MEEILGAVISDGIDNILHKANSGEFTRAEASWTKTGKLINYDPSFEGHLRRRDRTLSMRHRDNPKLKGLSDVGVNQATAEYRFFEAWFTCLSMTGEFNANFAQAFQKFQDLAKTHKSGIFSSNELAQCFAGI
ncbi:Ribosomal RNA small subunit methyltransferase J [Folsomia candida]|uniref:Ribosomal RNA small subunit methyltransferase J n=1 Tax=Folsomia candida TaxID=158441 RepID=A0A226DWN1_FOLCA|nr:Ribosomal RNA small subunit methyltransferase J [Folsomia candida]